MIIKRQLTGDFRNGQPGIYQQPLSLIDFLPLDIFQWGTLKFLPEPAAEMVFAHLHMAGKGIQACRFIQMGINIAGGGERKAVHSVRFIDARRFAYMHEKGLNGAGKVKFIRKLFCGSQSVQGGKMLLKGRIFKSQGQHVPCMQVVDNRVNRGSPEVKPYDF